MAPVAPDREENASGRGQPERWPKAPADQVIELVNDWEGASELTGVGDIEAAGDDLPLRDDIVQIRSRLPERIRLENGKDQSRGTERDDGPCCGATDRGS